MSQPALLIHVTHTGVYADGRPNTHSVLINDLDVGYENQNRKVPVYVPYGGSIDIPISNLALLSYSKGVIAKFASVGVVTATLFLRPASYSNATRPTASLVPAGVMIWNTDDTAPNYSDGVNWRDAIGNLT